MKLALIASLIGAAAAFAPAQTGGTFMTTPKGFRWVVMAESQLPP